MLGVDQMSLIPFRGATDVDHASVAACGELLGVEQRTVCSAPWRDCHAARRRSAGPTR